MGIVLAVVLGAVVGAALVVMVAFLPPHGWRRRPATTTPEPAPARPFAGLSLLDELPTALVVLDGADDIVYANGAAVAIGVLRGGRLTLGELKDAVHGARRDGRTRQIEVDLAPDTKRRRPLAVRARVVPAGGRDVAVFVDDLTEARRVEAVRRDFAANVSHELKTPVAAVALLAEAIADAGDDAATVHRFAARIQHETARLSRLVQEIIDLSRLQGADPLPDRRPVSLRRVVSEVIDRATPAADAKGVALRHDANDAPVAGDEAQLVTAVFNLVDNAIAYSEPGSTVSVAVREHDDAVELSVADRGIGIAEDDIERIFERFYRVDPARSRATGGTGLGLAIVKHIAGNHGGTVAVWSALGEGSTFTLRLPDPVVETFRSDGASPTLETASQ